MFYSVTSIPEMFFANGKLYYWRNTFLSAPMSLPFLCLQCLKLSFKLVHVCYGRNVRKWMLFVFWIQYTVRFLPMQNMWMVSFCSCSCTDFLHAEWCPCNFEDIFQRECSCFVLYWLYAGLKCLLLSYSIIYTWLKYAWLSALKCTVVKLLKCTVW